MNPVIEAEKLVKTFGNNITALDNVNLSIERGSAFGFLGPNGAGKTTTVRLLNGLLKPSSGKIRVLEKTVPGESDFLRQKCGVLTDTNLYERLTAFENLHVWGRIFEIPQTELEVRIKRLLEMLGLEERKNNLVSAFSKGMKQKLSIARALINDPEIIFLDEPTAGLDPEAAKDIIQYLKHMVKDGKRTVFLCSHRLEEVEELCDTIAIINRGKILIEGSVSGIINSTWKEHHFTIETNCALGGNLISEIRNAPQVSACRQNGSEIELMLKQRNGVSGIIRKILGTGAEIYAVAEKKHDLKDVYFLMMEKTAVKNEKK